ncbi:SDR family oxidoreductase [Alteromonas sediminis]|uniref:SDR family oxidoreductase n=1 Tax=Alteromonas sediminis TaxID=2259342 RepID=A0A3N5Y1Y0_9ALTE|nr:SDR family oxidoreductase [Alteromonas sediminis]RPJ66616.1 SDR family oxidoreductase [Alteromonas sediminis]
MMKTCLVTGASGGIGQAIAEALYKQGCRVLLQGRNVSKLSLLKQKLGERADMLVGDINLQSDRETILEKLRSYESIDLLVNAAGVSEFAAFESLQESRVAELVTTNLLSPILFIQAFVKMQSNSKSSQQITIVNVGSAFGYIGYPGFSVYAASKFGLRGFTESLRREFSDSRFSFAYFAPRATQTEINSSQVNNLNKALGNAVDSPFFVAEQFIQFLKKHKGEATIGWPEKLFIRVNNLLPAVVDSAIKSKLPVIKQFMSAKPAHVK